MVPLLRRRANPRLDVEYIRLLDTRDPQLAFSVILPEHVFWDQREHLACRRSVLL